MFGPVPEHDVGQHTSCRILDSYFVTVTILGAGSHA